MKKLKKLAVSIGIAAFNEEQNISRLLQTIQKQKLHTIKITEILVISSGSTDDTNQLVKAYAKRNSRISLITQKKRLGKASAVNLLLSRAKEEIICLLSADILLSPETIEKLVKHLRKTDVGIVGAHPVPLNDENSFFGYAAHLQWNLHHWISLQTPKMGECIAFRKIFKRIPEHSSVDETNIESLVVGQGYQAVYEPDAVIYNMGAQNLHEFIARRRHIYAGHLVTLHKYHHRVSTINSTNIIRLLLKHNSLSRQFILWTPMVATLEILSRLLGYLDYKFNSKKHTIWQITKSTKKLPLISQQA